MSIKNKPLKWHGGKSYLAKWIIERFPPHTHYVEPYFGGGAVLLSKPAALVTGHSEAVNDINGNLVNFWNVLRDPTAFTKLKRLAEATPFCELNFDAANMFLKLKGETDSVARAWAFFIQNRQSRQGLGRDFATLSRSRTRAGMNEQASSWLTAIDGLQETHERLNRVVVLNRPAVDVIKQQDGEKTLFYCDPPYLHETRATVTEYGDNEMSERDHAELLDTLASIKGKFILSGYPSSLYDGNARARGWNRDEKQIDNKASSKKKKDKKTECLFMNF